MDVSKLKLIGEGYTAEVYALGEDKVLKLFRKGIPEQIIVSEYETAQIVQSYMRNVPRAYELLPIGDHLAIVYERIFGQDMLQQMVKLPVKVDYYAGLLARTHIEVHKKTVMATGKYSVKNKLKNDIEAANFIDRNKKESVLDYLMGLPEGQALCHFDFHPGNIIMRDKEPVIIDWMTACVGDPCADIARTNILLMFGEMPNAGFVKRRFVSLFQRHVAKEYNAEYLKCEKISRDAVDKWMLPVAAARLREWIPDNEKKALMAFIDVKLT